MFHSSASIEMIERNQDNADVPAASPSFRMLISQHFLLYQTLSPLSDTRKTRKSVSFLFKAA